MTILITLDQAKEHLRIDDLNDPAMEEDLFLKMEQASAIILDYIEVIDSGWDETTVPEHIRVTVLMVLGNLWDHRGDDKESEPITEAIKSVLRRTRTPVLA